MRLKALFLNLFLITVASVCWQGNDRAFAQRVLCKSADRSANMIARSGYLRYQDSENGRTTLRVCYYRDSALVIELDSPHDPDVQQFVIAGYCRSGGGSLERRGRIDVFLASRLWSYAAERVGCK